MKKLLLTVSGSLLGLAMFAGTPANSKDSIKAVVNSWKANYHCVANPLVVTLNYDDSTICPTKNASGVINNKSFEPQGAAATTTTTYFDEAAKALRVDWTWTATSGPNWGDKMYNYWIHKVQPATQTAAFNPFKDSTKTTDGGWITPLDTVRGVMLNLTDTASRIVTITYKLVGLATTDSANIRFDLYDVNGRSTGGHSAKRTIGTARPGTLVPNDNQYHDVTFSWDGSQGKDWAQDKTQGMLSGTGDAPLNDEMQKSFSDGYDATWFNVPNGRGYGATAAAAPTGLFGFEPNSAYGGTGNSKYTGDSYDIDLDAAHIIGFGFMLNDGPSATYHSLGFSILIKKIVIGDPLSVGSKNGDEFIFGGPNATPEPVAAKLVKAAKKITPNIGSKFAFEGKGTMVNILGQVVATGTSSIDASSLATGVYYIIIDGVASKVIVK